MTIFTWFYTICPDSLSGLDDRLGYKVDIFEITVNNRVRGVYIMRRSN